jgi:hypothetical protein
MSTDICHDACGLTGPTRETAGYPALLGNLGNSKKGKGDNDDRRIAKESRAGRP